MSDASQAVIEHHRWRVAQMREARRRTMLERYGVESINDPRILRIKMSISDWYRDEFGNCCRIIRNADG